MRIFRRHVSVKQPAHHLKEIGHRQHDPQHGHHHLEGIFLPCADDNHDFGNKVHGARHPDRCHTGDNKGPGQERHILDQSSQGWNVPGMGLVIYPACHGEEHARGQGMCKHVNHRAGQADVIQGGHAQEHVAHVTGTGIADDVLRVLGEICDKSAVDNAEHTQHRGDGHEFPRGVRKDFVRHANNGEMAEFHQYAGVQHAGRGRGRGVADGRP